MLGATGRPRRNVAGRGQAPRQLGPPPADWRLERRLEGGEPVRPRVLSRAEPGQASVLGSEHARREEVAHGGALLVANGKADARGLGRADLASVPDGNPRARGKRTRVETYCQTTWPLRQGYSRKSTRARDPDRNPCPPPGVARSTVSRTAPPLALALPASSTPTRGSHSTH